VNQSIPDNQLLSSQVVSCNEPIINRRNAWQQQ